MGHRAAALALLALGSPVCALRVACAATRATAPLRVAPPAMLAPVALAAAAPGVPGVVVTDGSALVLPLTLTADLVDIISGFADSPFILLIPIGAGVRADPARPARRSPPHAPSPACVLEPH